MNCISAYIFAGNRPNSVIFDQLCSWFIHPPLLVPSVFPCPCFSSCAPPPAATADVLPHLKALRHPREPWWQLTELLLRVAVLPDEKVLRGPDWRGLLAGLWVESRGLLFAVGVQVLG